MNSESARLQTFCNWPSSAPVDPPRIAKAGFYFTGEGLEVQCFCCRSKISRWSHGDEVMWRHRQVKPNCPFVVNPAESGNIPIMDVFECNNTDETAHWQVEEPHNEDERGLRDYGLVEEDEMYRNDSLRLLSFINWDGAPISREAVVNAGFYNAGEGQLRCAWCGGVLTPYDNFSSLGDPIEIHRMYFPRCDHAATVEAAQRSRSRNLTPLAAADTPPIRSPETNYNQALSSGAAHNSRILNAGNTWRALGVVSSGARHPNYASLSTRLSTFDRWPADRTQSSKEMAEAGFFHAGVDDQVRCFYCDGGLGRWDEGDAPWSEHARWFPSCGYVLLVKGPEYVDQCRESPPDNSTVQNPKKGVSVNNRNPGITFPVTDDQIDECMESMIAMGALGAGLDAARVRRALARRLRTTGTPFTSSEALIDAVLDDQLNEESWSVSSQSQRFARDILAETLRELAPRNRLLVQQEDSQTSESDRTRSPSPNPVPSFVRGPISNLNRSRQRARHHRSNNQNQATNQYQPNHQNQQTSQYQPTNQNQPTNRNQPMSQMQPNRQNQPTSHNQSNQSESQAKSSDKSAERAKSENRECSASENRSVSLEEENRQLKEARLCKVCMDNEVSVVFLPCGHLVSCAGCGAALAACPLCRSAVRALVRAYLA